MDFYRFGNAPGTEVARVNLGDAAFTDQDGRRYGPEVPGRPGLHVCTLPARPFGQSNTGWPVLNEPMTFTFAGGAPVRRGAVVRRTFRKPRQATAFVEIEFIAE